MDAATWERVQAKAVERSKRATLARTGTYILPSGILHCGQCGGRMYGTTMRFKRGGKVYEYRKYLCASYNVKPATCHSFSIDEDIIVRALVNKLMEEYTAPGRLEELQAARLEKVQKRHEGAPQQADRLRKRLDSLDREIKVGSRNLLRLEDDDAFTEAQAELNQWLVERERLRKELEAAEKAQAVPVADEAEKVEQEISSLIALRQRLATADPGQLGEVLRQLVSRVDLYFEKFPANGDRLRYRCVKGAIKLRPALEIPPVAGNGATGT